MRRVRGQSSLNCNIKRRLFWELTRWKGTKATLRTQCAMVLPTLHKNSIVHSSFQSIFQHHLLCPLSSVTYIAPSRYSHSEKLLVFSPWLRETAWVFVATSSNCCSFTTLQTPVIISQNPSNTMIVPLKNDTVMAVPAVLGVPVLLRLEQTPFEKRCGTLCWAKLQHSLIQYLMHPSHMSWGPSVCLRPVLDHWTTISILPSNCAIAQEWCNHFIISQGT